MKINDKNLIKNITNNNENDLSNSTKRNLIKQKYSNSLKENTLNKFNLGQIGEKTVKKSINFDENYVKINKDKEEGSSNLRKSSQINRNSSIFRSIKNKRKSEIMKFNIVHPLSYIESIKNIEDKNTIYGKFRIKILIYDIIITLFSLCSVILICIDNNIYINNSRNYIKNLCEEKKLYLSDGCFLLFKHVNKRKITKIENSLRILNLICCIICCLFVNLKFRIYILNLRLEQKISKFGGLKEAGFINIYILENLINIIFYPPHLNNIIYGKKLKTVYVYSLNSIFLSLSYLKLYNLLIVLMHLSRFNTKISQTICKSHKVKPGLYFVIKSEINRKTKLSILILLMIFCFCFSFISRGFENMAIDIERGLEGKKGTNDLQNLINNVWMILTTINKIGYGDEYPRTDLGRFFIFFIYIIGIFCLSLTTASMTSSIDFTSDERRAYLKLKKIFNPENGEHKAANVIKTIILMNKNIKNRNNVLMDKIDNLKEKIILYLKIRGETIVFKDELHVARTYSMPITDLIKSLEMKLYKSVVNFTKQLEKINLVENDLNELQQNQKDIQKKLKNIQFMQEKISDSIVEKHNQNIIDFNKKKNSKNNKIQFSKINKTNVTQFKNPNNKSIIKKNKKLSKISFSNVCINFNIHNNLIDFKNEKNNKKNFYSNINGYTPKNEIKEIQNEIDYIENVARKKKKVNKKLSIIMPVNELNKRKRSFSECVDYRKFNLSIIPKKLNKKKKKQMKKNLLDSLNDSNSLDLSIINKKH